MNAFIITGRRGYPMRRRDDTLREALLTAARELAEARGSRR